MQKIDTIEGLEEEAIEAMFVERACSIIEEMGIPAFNGEGLELARSEREIAKCKQLAERALVKEEYKRRDAESRTQNGEDLTSAERRRKNKKTKSTRTLPARRGRPAPRSEDRNKAKRANKSK